MLLNWAAFCFSCYLEHILSRRLTHLKSITYCKSFKLDFSPPNSWASSHKHQINMNKWGECSSVGFGWVSLSNLLEVKACGLFCCGWIVLSKYVPILLPSCFCVYKTSREYTSYIYNDCLYMKYKLPIYLFFQDFCDLLCTRRFRFWHFLISPNPK